MKPDLVEAMCRAGHTCCSISVAVKNFCMKESSFNGKMTENQESVRQQSYSANKHRQNGEGQENGASSTASASQNWWSAG